jgi:hypothetical protein
MLWERSQRQNSDNNSARNRYFKIKSAKKAMAALRTVDCERTTHVADHGSAV